MPAIAQFEKCKELLITYLAVVALPNGQWQDFQVL
jgi:hypothetical protein